MIGIMEQWSLGVMGKKLDRQSLIFSITPLLQHSTAPAFEFVNPHLADRLEFPSL
jgi:hypothetical protein